jgi:hypothetical protein
MITLLLLIKVGISSIFSFVCKWLLHTKSHHVFSAGEKWKYKIEEMQV